VDILALRGALATALTNHLGTYTLANGSSTPALVVRDPGGGLPAGLTATGLEVVISSVPDLEAQQQYRNSPFLETWNVFLIDWGGGDIAGATTLVQSLFAGTTAVILAVTEGIGPRRQTQLRIPLSKDGQIVNVVLPQTSVVQSVNGQTGDVSLGLGDLTDVETTGLIEDSVLAWDATADTFEARDRAPLPTGGDPGNVLLKNGNANYQAGWVPTVDGGTFN
jgi:hypothetical protein